MEKRKRIRNPKLFEEFSVYLDYLNLRPGASKATITAVEAKLAISLPEQYLEFLRFSNGAEGFIGPSYVMFWGIDELEQFNREWTAAEFVPDLLLIGLDGGGEAYAITLKGNSFGMVPFIGMHPTEFRFLGKTFLEFLDYLIRDE